MWEDVNCRGGVCAVVGAVSVRMRPSRELRLDVAEVLIRHGVAVLPLMLPEDATFLEFQAH